MRKKNLFFLLMLALLLLPCCRTQAALIKPKILSAKSEYGKVTLTWREVPGSTNYYIFRKGGGREYKRIAQLSAAAGLSYVDTDLKPGISYTYTMKALRFITGRERVVSDLAKEVTVITKIPAVTLGSAEAGNNKITVTWEKIPDVSGYRIYRKEGTEDYKMLTDVDKTASSWKDKDVLPGIPYRYTVRAFVKEKDELRLGLKNNTSVRATVDLPVPELKAQAASGRVHLRWTMEDGTDGYQIYRRPAGSSVKFKRIIPIKSGTLFTCWDATVVPGKTYEYAIRSYVVYNRTRYYSNASTGVSVQCFPGNVIPLSLTREGNRDVLKWQKVKGCSSYIIYKKNAETKWKWLRAAVVKAGVTQKKLVRSAGSTSYTIRARVQAGKEMLLSPRYFSLDNTEKRYTQQKVLFAGDSITWGVCWDDNRKPAAVTYPKRIAQLTGISADNFGYPGASVAKTVGLRIKKVLEAKKVDYTKYSAIVLAGGTNDYARDVPLGNIYDRSEATFYGAWNELLTGIRAVNKEAKIVLVLPLFRIRDKRDGYIDSYITKNSAGLTMKQYANAIKKIARKYDAEIFDAAAVGALTNKDDILLRDGVHLTEEGYILIGDALAKMLESILPKDSAKRTEPAKTQPETTAAQAETRAPETAAVQAETAAPETTAAKAETEQPAAAPAASGETVGE